MTTNHTPGSWHYTEYGEVFLRGKDGHYIANEKGEVLAVVRPGWFDGTVKANAQLMATAPKLLKALELLCEAISEGDPEKIANLVLTHGVPAIKKAKGK